MTRSPAKYRLVSPLLATIARHKGPLNYYADRFLIVVAAATTIQSLVIGWRDQFPDFRIFYVSAWLMRRGGDPYLGLAGQGLAPTPTRRRSSSSPNC